MARHDLVVRGGTVITPSCRLKRDIVVDGGVITALTAPGASGEARRVIDADGMLVMPGLVDTHVHLMEPGDTTREDFLTGTTAAALQGVTTLVEHNHEWPVTTRALLEEKLQHLQGRSHVDFGLAAHVVPEHILEIPGLWSAGVTFFKAFTCTTHGIPGLTSTDLLSFLRVAARLDSRCLIHCEDEALTTDNERVLRSVGRGDGALIPEWRSREAELLAVAMVSLAARLAGASVVIAHASSADVLDLISALRSEGSPVRAETCPQYLFLEEGEVFTEGPFRKFTPPARIRSEFDRQKMWARLNDGSVDLVSSDHAPSTAGQKTEGDIWDAPFGLPGLDSTFPLLLDAALRGETSLERISEVYARNPARIYRLSGKGEIIEGGDADLVLIDPESTRVLKNEAVVSKAGWTPYDGVSVRGAPKRTFIRGVEVAEDGQLRADPGGRFLVGPGARSRG